MELEALSCNSCGAPIEVPGNAMYVTCAHCGSRLVVKRTETVHYTEVLERLQTHAAGVDSQISELRTENELLRLDQDWERAREEYMVGNSNGVRVEPTLIQVVVSGIVSVGVALFLCFAATMGRDGIPANWLYLAAAISLGFGVWICAYYYKAYAQYRNAKASYDAQRDAILSRRVRR